MGGYEVSSSYDYEYVGTYDAAPAPPFCELRQQLLAFAILTSQARPPLAPSALGIIYFDVWPMQPAYGPE